MATPAWLAAAAGKQGNAGAITQFLGAHTAQWVYDGAQLAVQGAAGSDVYQPMQAQSYYAQQFTTGASQTTIGRVALQISTIGGSPLTATIPPLTVALYASQVGEPSGTALASTTVTEPYVYDQPFWCSIPMAAGGLTAATPYWLVASTSGSPDAYYVWQQSDQTSGAATSPDGTAWTGQSYGLMYQIYDTAASGRLVSIVEDEGARITTLTWSGSTLTGLTEYTQQQGGGTLVSSRSLTYSNGLLVGVA